MNQKEFAEVIVDISHESVDRPFTYKIPKSLMDTLEIGMCVNVPFGAGNKLRKAIVVNLKETIDFPIEKCKWIDSISEKSISMNDHRIALAAWMKRNYGSTMIQALKTVLPVKQKVNVRTQKVLVRKKSVSEIQTAIETSIQKRNVAQLRLLYSLMEEAIIPKRFVEEKLHISTQTIKKLEGLGFFDIEDVKEKPGERKTDFISNTKIELSTEQSMVVSSVCDDLHKETYGAHLIFGITGSGKTEVYMSIIEEALRMGKQAIVLIPEIALTYQTLMRFYHRFGERVSVMNSTMTQGERYTQYERAVNGEIDIIIGPRSALFVPFMNVGVVVIDEEHETSYKSENMPKYHARETAEQICRMKNAVLVLGSATPSLDAFYKAEQGEYVLHKLTKRNTQNQLPNVHVADLREELRSGNRSILSGKLAFLMQERLDKGEQMMLFLNRRGVAGFISCRACGFVVKCPHCDVSMTLHKNGKMVCHYCGYTMDKYTLCPECGSKYIMGFRAGTEDVEETVKKMFPTARVLRMDADTTKDKDSYEKILSSFLDHEADVLVGTQMIVKGHDFKNVTLVGVLAADMSLHQADFRAAERTFQLLTQAAGRAGRGDVAGDVVIQTYQPDHYCIEYAKNQDYEGFYNEEVGYRELMDYPPAGHLLNVLVTGKQEDGVKKLTDAMANAVKTYYNSRVIGPCQAQIGKINDVYRYVFYIKDQEYDKLVEIKDYLEENLLKIKNKKENVLFDFDPQNMI